jgi:hypothetical protein
LSHIPIIPFSQDLGAADSIDQVGKRLVSSTDRNCVRPHNGNVPLWKPNEHLRVRVRGIPVQKKLWIVILAGSLIVGGSIYYYAATNFLSFDCASSVLSETSSPDGRYISTVFERNCGATSPYLRIVNLRPKGTPLRVENDSSSVFATEGQPNVEVNWTGPRQLVVVTHGYSRVPNEQRLKAAHWKDVAVVLGPS